MAREGFLNMHAGELRHRIQLQSYTLSQDAFGAPTKAWSTYATVWASVEPLSGREALIAQQANPELSHLVTIRYNSTVNAATRVLHDYAAQTIEGIDLPSGSEVSIEITGHGLSTGDEVTFVGVGATVELNGNSYIITKVDGDNFTLDGTDGDDFTAWTTGGTAGTARVFDVNVVKDYQERHIFQQLLCKEAP